MVSKSRRIWRYKTWLRLSEQPKDVSRTRISRRCWTRARNYTRNYTTAISRPPATVWFVVASLSSDSAVADQLPPCGLELVAKTTCAARSATRSFGSFCAAIWKLFSLYYRDAARMTWYRGLAICALCKSTLLSLTFTELNIYLLIGRRIVESAFRAPRAAAGWRMRGYYRSHTACPGTP